MEGGFCVGIRSCCGLKDREEAKPLTRLPPLNYPSTGKEERGQSCKAQLRGKKSPSRLLRKKGRALCRKFSASPTRWGTHFLLKGEGEETIGDLFLGTSAGLSAEISHNQPRSPRKERPRKSRRNDQVGGGLIKPSQTLISK